MGESTIELIGSDQIRIDNESILYLPSQQQQQQQQATIIVHIVSIHYL